MRRTCLAAVLLTSLLGLAACDSETNAVANTTPKGGGAVDTANALASGLVGIWKSPEPNSDYVTVFAFRKDGTVFNTLATSTPTTSNPAWRNNGIWVATTDSLVLTSVSTDSSVDGKTWSTPRPESGTLKIAFRIKGDSLYLKMPGEEIGLIRGSASDTVMIASTLPVDTVKLTDTLFTDARDGKTYRAVKIGSLVWMAQNLSYAAAAYSCYDGLAANCTKYGKLYPKSDAFAGSSISTSSSAVIAGVCPTGWRLPTTADFTSLVAAAGGGTVAAANLLSKSEGGKDLVGFAGLMGGAFVADEDFMDEGYIGYFWVTDGRNFSLDGDTKETYYVDTFIGDHVSVRCVKK